MAFVNIDDTKKYLTTPDGKPFYMIGTNYEGYYDRAWRMWDDGKFDLALITRDFRKMAAAQLNVVRLFVSTSLEADVRANNFDKLDRVLQIAAENKLMVMLTFNDAHRLDLAFVAGIDAKIAHRYQDDPVIMGWDLENEPRFYNIAAAVYPQANPAPIQTNILVDHYGAQISQQEALTLQSQGRIPRHLNPQHAFYYINALQYFVAFAGDANQWISRSGKNLVDYMYSTASARWHKLIEVLNGTMAAWLAVRQTPVRNADPNHLTTVGYNWLYLAALAANRTLDFQQYHKYGVASLSATNRTFQDLAGMQTAFPNHPIILGEFGYSNFTTSNPATAKPVSDHVTALFESAVLAHMRAKGFAGALKWMLNDVDTNANPYEANFGIYGMGDNAKAIRDLLARFNAEWPAPPVEGEIKVVRDPVGLAMRLDVGNRVMLSGGVFQDEAYSWQPENIAHCFLTVEEDKLVIEAQGKGRLTVDPWDVISTWDRERGAILSRELNNQFVEQATFSPDTPVSWQLVPGVSYQISMSPAPEPPPGPDPEIIPNPGEHVVLLPGSNQLQVALPYIRKFAPDISFAPDRVSGRWAYVTVIASESQISEAVLETFRAGGAQIVDRISDGSGDGSSDTATILSTLVSRNQRFLSSDLLNPPTDPPTDPGTTPPPEEVQVYTVEPGDSLSAIARKFYGQSSLWTLIFEANQDILDSPSNIRPGMQLKIPPKP